MTKLTLAAFAGLIGVVLAPTIQADDWNKKTILTVNETIQMPSCCTPDHTVTLPPESTLLRWWIRCRTGISSVSLPKTG